MDNRDDSDSTLPSLETGLDYARPAQELVLTIIFHPELSRIGEVAVLPRSNRPQLLGRNTMAFARDAAGGNPLVDRHVSREALILKRKGASVLIRRREDSCRCRVAGVELWGERELNASELSRGVPILLAHSVVLLLSLASRPEGSFSPDIGLLGSSDVMCRLREQIFQVARSDLDVLIQGETGTGKELVANAIHRESSRSGKRLVSVNVAAIPDQLAAAALFGSTRGAFTGANQPKPGYFQEAEGGILFLDEIGEAPGEVQPQLLRALQQREVQAVGGTIRKVDLRVVSATDALLDGESAGFKSALRHRLGALEISIPALREHPADLGELLSHYLSDALGGLGYSELLPGIDSEACEIASWAGLFHEALCYHWPGNVRQLINVCSQIAVASEEGLVVPEAVLALFSRPAEDPSTGSDSAAYRPLAEVSAEEFDQAMRESHYEAAGVARRLGVSRPSVYRRMESSAGLYRKVSELSEPELQKAVRECDGDALAAAQLLRVSASGLRSRMRTV